MLDAKIVKKEKRRVKLIILIGLNTIFISIDSFQPWQASEFNTLADIRLRNFTNAQMPNLSMNAAGDLLLEEFDGIVQSQANQANW